MKVFLCALITIVMLAGQAKTEEPEFNFDDMPLFKESLEDTDTSLGNSESIEELLNNPDFKNMPMHEELKKLLEEMQSLGLDNLNLDENADFGGMFGQEEM